MAVCASADPQVHLVALVLPRAVRAQQATGVGGRWVHDGCIAAVMIGCESSPLLGA